MHRAAVGQRTSGETFSLPRRSHRARVIGGPYPKEVGRIDAHILCNKDSSGLFMGRTEAFEICGVSMGNPLIEGRRSEDSIALLPTPSGVVLAVADGAGGHPQGDVASKVAIEAVVRAVRSNAMPLGNDLRAAILDGFEAANGELLKQGAGAATTLAVVEVQTQRSGLFVRSYHAGDSSVVLYGGRGKLKWATVSHSPVGYAVEAGILDADAALSHEDLNIVSNLVGRADLRIEMGPLLSMAPRDTVILGSDGLFDNILPSELSLLVRQGNLEELAERLLSLVQKRMLREAPGPSKPDDVCFFLIRGAAIHAARGESV